MSVTQNCPCTGSPECLCPGGEGCTCTQGGECPCTRINPEPCPEGTYFTAGSCQDAVNQDLKPTALMSLGRIVQLDVTIQAVCPGKRLAVSVILREVDPQGKEHPRGVKHLLVPAQTGEGCRDVTLRCIQFSVPEALNPAGTGDSICGSRKFRAQVLANYVDTDYVSCCEEKQVL